ncbi:WavQ [Enterobacteriaceae bacterium H4N4]|uniref:WavQ n=1 Tax=Silvania confinis TaxID=2926470 RepID=A0A9J6QLI9_9ENTR|nr:WavQ [Silvania confinis]MCU6670154.1 WavQ [Silvania confinis]
MKIVICAPTFDENSGGAIVLHRLCDIINENKLGSAFITPLLPEYLVAGGLRKLFSQAKWLLKLQREYRVNSSWNTPIITRQQIADDYIVIYPEIVLGNPLGANNVVRWFLHQPGFHTGKFDYGRNELYFKFNTAIDDFENEGSTLSTNEMKIIFYPLDIYKKDDEVIRDIECCHMIRKGGYKKKVHPENSVCVDGLNHKETADIFKRSQKFICYDDYTAYSLFAVLSGCASYVVPGDDVTIEQWYPNVEDRYGLSYGFSDAQQLWANSTKDRVEQHLIKEHELSVERVRRCLEEMKLFFSKTLDNNKTL